MVEAQEAGEATEAARQQRQPLQDTLRGHERGDSRIQGSAVTSHGRTQPSDCATGRAIHVSDSAEIWYVCMY